MSTKDEIRAALEAHQAGVAWFMSNDALDDYLRELTDVLAALLPEETETVEWGVRCEYGVYNPPGLSEADARIDAGSNRHHQGFGCDRPTVVHRTVTTYATKRTPWEDA